jgi:hypothetical protein
LSNAPVTHAVKLEHRRPANSVSSAACLQPEVYFNTTWHFVPSSVSTQRMHPRGLQIHSGFFAAAPVERAIDAVACVVAAIATAQRVDMIAVFIVRLLFQRPELGRLVLETRDRPSAFKAARPLPRKSDKK